MAGVGETAEKKLYDAVLRGDLSTFQQLLRGNPYHLDVISFAGSRNLLHVAIIWGQPAIVEEVLRIYPQLVRSSDSQNSSPLHIAAALGQTQIARQLFSVAPEMCWWRDCQGMNPIHVAAMNGHIEILEALIAVDPSPAMEVVESGQTVLHLCVKHHQLRALNFLMDKLGDNFILTKNDNKETLLHMTAKYQKLEMIKFLVENTTINKQSRDSLGRTASDIAKGSTREIIDLLEDGWINIPLETSNMMTDAIMVVVVLIATMAFQAAVSPPGGVWQDNSSTHKAGEAVMASSHPKIYKNFVRANTTAFVSSLITIFLLANKLSRNFFTLCGVWYSMIVSMASIAVSYGASITVTTPNNQTRSLSRIITIVIAVVLGLIGFIFVVALFRSWFIKYRKYLRAPPRQTLYQCSTLFK